MKASEIESRIREIAVRLDGRSCSACASAGLMADRLLSRLILEGVEAEPTRPIIEPATGPVNVGPVIGRIGGAVETEDGLVRRGHGAGRFPRKFRCVGHLEILETDEADLTGDAADGPDRRTGDGRG